MKIAIFTEKDYIFMFPQWLKLIDNLRREGHEIAGLFLFPAKLGNFKGWNIYKYYLDIFGFYSFLKLTAVSLYLHLRQIIANFFLKKPFTYKQLEKFLNVPVLSKKNPNSEEVADWVKRNNIDILIISFGYIIKKPLFEAVRVTTLNKHSAILPSFRGLMPVFWALLHNAPIGATVHKVNESIDAGEVLYQKLYSSDSKKISVFKYYQMIYNDLADSLQKAINILEGKKNKIILGADTASSYFGLPTTQDYKNFRRKGYRFI